MQTEISLDVSQYIKELQNFTSKVANNIHIGGLRLATATIKDEISRTNLKYGYSKSFKKSQIKIKKHKRTRRGWERFSIRIDVSQDEYKQTSSLRRYDFIQNSKLVKRKTKKGLNRGRLASDKFMARASDNAHDRALNAYKVYLIERIKRDGGKLFKVELKGLL